MSESNTSPEPAPARGFSSRDILTALLIAAVVAMGFKVFYLDGVADQTSKDAPKASQAGTSQNSPSDSNYTPTEPTKLVSQHLPQVAVIGQKDGPAGSTEVFIQVPGVTNMQSVYVLDDNKTVLSGVVLPPIDGGAVPGGQLEMPTGQPTVNPRAKRPDGEAVRRMLDGQSVTPAASKTPENANTESPTPYNPGQKAPESQGATADRNSQKVPAPAPIEPRSKSTAPSHNATAGDSSNDSASSAQSAPGSNGQSDQAKAIPSRSEYQSAVSKTIDTHPTISAVRGSGEGETDAKQQQERYYEAVSSMPAVTQGDGKRDLYAFFDPNCPVCHELYSDVLEYVGSGELTVHWIPAAVFSQEPSSIGVSAQILHTLETKGNEAALSMLEATLSDKDGAAKVFGNFTPDRHSAYVEQVTLGTSLMAVAKPATPLLVFKNQSGNLVVDSGIPSPGWVAQIASK